MKKTLVLYLLVLTTVLAVPAWAARDMDAPIPPAPQIRVGHLANGLTYYILKNARPAKTAELRLVVRAGSILEDDDQQGLAHFTEHMAFNGSRHFRKHELISFLESIGVKFGADLNAYTSFDETVYILPIPTDKKANLGKAMDVLEDWAGGLTFDPVEIDRERGVVLEESRLGKGAADRMNQVLWPKIFEGSQYARRLPIGKDEIIRNFNYDALKRFYADWYRPDLMAVVVVGDVEPKTVEQMIRRRFSKLKNPPHERARLYAPLPRRTTEAAVVASDKEASTEMLNITYWQGSDPGEATFGGYRERLVQDIFNALLGQRLQELTQKADPPFVAGNSGVAPFVRGYRQFSSVALIGSAGVAPALQALVDENRRAAQFGFTADELERVKKSILRSMEQAYIERDKTESGSYAAEFIRNFLMQEAIPGITNEFAYVKEFLPTISLAEINRYASQTINRNEAKLVTYQGMEQPGAVLPEGAALLAGIAAAGQRVLTPYDETAVAPHLMEQAPSGGTIVSESVNAALGVTELKLGNGVRVLLKPTTFKNDEVLMTATRNGGDSLYADRDLVNARYAAGMVGAMGIGKFSPNDLQKVLAGRAVGVGPFIGDLREGINGQSGSTEIETMLQMTYLYFTAPRRDPVLYQAWLGRMQDSVKGMQARPESLFQDDVLKALYADHPRAPRMPRLADFTQLELDRSLAIYRERFASARGYTFVFAGSFDLAKIKPLIASYLGSLPGGEIASAYRDVGLRPVRGVVKQQAHLGMEQKSTIAITFSGDASYSPDARLTLAALVDVLNLRLTERLRAEMGAVYGVSASGDLTRDPYSNYEISLTIPCAPENVERLIAAALGEIEQLKNSGPQTADLNKVKQNWLKSWRESLRTNNFWINILRNGVERGDDPARVLTYERRVKAMTPAELQAAARRYFDLHNYVQDVLYPAAKLATQP